jgi:voltage-gated potassium channel
MDAEQTEMPIAYGPGMDARSTRVAEILNVPVMTAAALALPMVAITEAHPGGWLEDLAGILNWVTWSAFLIELTVMLAVVPDRRTWLRHNPLDLILVLVTPPVLPPGMQGLRVLRLLRLLGLQPLTRLTRRLFSLQGLHYAALLSVLTAVGGGALFVALESENQHLTTWEGIYWAVTTMTTLNSSIAPSTTGSEILSAFILLVGIAFVALLTGAFAQRFLGPEIAEVEEELEAEALSAEAIALRELHSVREQLEALEIAVERLVDKRAPR